MTETLDRSSGCHLLISGLIVTAGIAGVGSVAFGMAKHAVVGVIIGATLAILASMIYCTRLLARTVARYLQPAEDAYKHGNQVGYDRGWIEGRKAGRPQSVTELDKFRGKSG